jgi:hypothetical protein
VDFFFPGFTTNRFAFWDPGACLWSLKLGPSLLNFEFVSVPFDKDYSYEGIIFSSHYFLIKGYL